MYGAYVLINDCLDKCMPAAPLAAIPNETKDSTTLVWRRGRWTLEHTASDCEYMRGGPAFQNDFTSIHSTAAVFLKEHGLYSAANYTFIHNCFVQAP